MTSSDPEPPEPEHPPAGEHAPPGEADRSGSGTGSASPPESAEAVPSPHAPRVRVLAAGHLHPGILFLRFLDGLRQMIFPVVLGLLVEPVFLVIAGVLFVVNMAYGLARYLTYQYRLTEEELIITEGILHRQERRIPVNRIQDLSFESTIVRRVFGLVVVTVETASGKGFEAQLDSLGRPEAERLREVLTQLRSGVDETGATVEGGEQEPAEERAVLPQEFLVFRSTSGELLLRGLTNTRLGAMLVGLFALIEFAGQFGLDAQVNQAFGGVMGWLSRFPWPVMVALLAGIAFVAVAGGMIVSAIAMVVMFHGFHLTLRGEVVQRRYGLLTTRAASLPKRKIQRVTVEQSLLRRMLGMAVVRADSAGSGMSEAEEIKRGNDVIVPLASLDRAWPMVPVLLPGTEPWNLVWQPVSPKVILRIFLKGVLLCALALAISLPTLELLALLFLVILPLGWLVGYLSFQNLAWSRDAGHLALRWGILGRYYAIVPYRKVQAVVLRAGPVERVLGLATLTVYVAGGSPTSLSNLTRAEAEALERDLAEAAARARFVW